MEDISAFGMKIRLTASNTFPNGIEFTQFPDDTDPFDSPAITLGEAAMGLNGDLITWAKAAIIPVVINLIPNSEDDQNMEILAENNRVGKGKLAIRDIIDLQVFYPDGTTKSKTQGAILTAIMGLPVSSNGRMKSKAYGFAFENIS